MKKVYQVEFKGFWKKFVFETKQEAQDFATVIATFQRKQYIITQVFVKEEAF